MSANPFKPAVREEQKARILVTGPAGSGKTHTATEIAHAFGERIAVIDTEYDRAKLFADTTGPFDHVTLSQHQPRHYVELIDAAAANGYDVVVIDSLSHAWKAVLSAVDATTNRGGKQDGREGWRHQRPEHDALMRAIIYAPVHIIATARSKMEYDWEDRQKRAIGYAPIQDGELPYEFDFVLDMDSQHTGTVTKVRGCAFMDGRSERRPSRAFMAEFRAWLDSGAERAAPQQDPKKLEALAKERARSLMDAGPEAVVVAAMKRAGIRSAELHDDDTFHRAQAAVVAAVEAAEAPAEASQEEAA